ncbi:MAG: hypothetical protein RMK29_01935 [Myxococcales bacterium]|nr:hypothetical protein [Myxococcota bacterium]MDW8280441.1 hypothetical protein [Myxococcales bacterium]
MSQFSDDIKQQLQGALGELKTLRDEIKVRLHLASMEAKTRWQQDLEPRLAQLETQLRDTGERVEEAARQRLAELMEAFGKFFISLGQEVHPTQQQGATQASSAQEAGQQAPAAQQGPQQSSESAP